MSDSYDLVIVGGGIHGCGIAQAAAAAGYRVCLLEQTALAHGTSSRSSKLVHGGLRYLESGQLRLVWESLHERRLLLAIAPELVRMQPFHIPIYASTRRRPWQIRAGLSLYALLAAGAGGTRFSTLARAQWSDLDGLRTDALQAVFRYHDAQTDDAALTRAVMRSAQSLGAELLMPAQFLRAEISNDGGVVHCLSGGREQSLHAKVLVNAGGPWAAALIDSIRPHPPAPAVELIRGSHILLPGTLAQGIYYLEAPQDGRAVFAMPHGDGTLIGTTEASFRDAPEQVVATAEDRAYLLGVARHYFSRWQAATEIGSFAGLRVLPAGTDRAFGRSRETMLIADRAERLRVISVLGGKLTTYRATAAKVIARIAPSLPSRRRRGDTHHLPLHPD